MKVKKMKAIKCPSCGANIKAGTRRCEYCGTYLANTISDAQSRISTPNPMALIPGTVLNNRYRINSMVGQGGFGIVYDGTDIELNRHVAIKEFFPGSNVFRNAHASAAITVYGDTPSYYKGLEDFYQEGVRLAQFSGDPNIVSVYHTFRENDTAYLVMEFLDGQTLEKQLKERGKLSWEETLRIVKPVTNALERVHAKGFLHRDVTPSNIMIGKDGNVKLLDFGAARQSDPDDRSLSVILKYDYAPPEQFDRHGIQGTYTDVYALCTTIYQMLAGDLPNRAYDGTIKTLSQIGIKVPPAAEEAIMSGLQTDYKKRLQTVTELRDALFTEKPAEAGAKKTAGGRSKNGGKWIAAFLISAAIAVFAVLMYKGFRPAGQNTAGTNSADQKSGVSDSEKQAEAEYYKTVYVKNMEIKEYTKPFTHEAGTEIIAVIKNNSIETRTVEMKVTAIDKNSGETVTNGDTVFAVAPGETTIATTWFEHQVDSFEASYTCSKTEELSIINDLEVEATQNACNLILAVTNNSKYIGHLSAYGLFMDENGKVIGLDMEGLCDADVMSLLPGETRYVELDCSRYDNVVYDNVEYYFQGFASRPDAETAKSVADISDFDFGEYLIKSKYGGYNYVLTTKNNSGKEVVIKGTAIAYDEEGTPIGVVDNTLQAIAPGEESALEFTFFDLTDISKVEYKLDFGKPLYTMSLCSQISAEEIVKDDEPYLRLVNNSDKTADDVDVYVIFMDENDNPVCCEWEILFDMEPGVVYEEWLFPEEEYDHIKCYIAATYDLHKYGD